jgi:hypothetical protein
MKNSEMSLRGALFATWQSRAFQLIFEPRLLRFARKDGEKTFTMDDKTRQMNIT